MNLGQDESQQSLRSWAVMRRTFLNQCYKNVHLILLLPSNATFARRQCDTKRTDKLRIRDKENVTKPGKWKSSNSYKTSKNEQFDNKNE
eukprot:3138073-Amphidinium_carterae.1